MVRERRQGGLAKLPLLPFAIPPRLLAGTPPWPPAPGRPSGRKGGGPRAGVVLLSLAWGFSTPLFPTLGVFLGGRVLRSPLFTVHFLGRD